MGSLCKVILVLVCYSARLRQRVKQLRRHRTAVSTTPSTAARNSSSPVQQPVEYLASQHTLPALPTRDLSIPLPANGDVRTGSLNWMWNTHPTRPDWSPTLSRSVGSVSSRNYTGNAEITRLDIAGLDSGQWRTNVFYSSVNVQSCDFSQPITPCPQKADTLWSALTRSQLIFRILSLLESAQKFQ